MGHALRGWGSTLAFAQLRMSNLHVKNFSGIALELASSKERKTGLTFMECGRMLAGNSWKEDRCFRELAMGYREFHF